MPTADELFKSGKLQAAIEAQTQAVKEKPGDHARRLFLFELLAFAGDLERAKKQLSVVECPDPEVEATRMNYLRLLEAEAARRKVFTEGARPKFLVEPPEHVELRLQALAQLKNGQAAEARATLEEAAAKAPPIKGQLNGKPFTDLRDGDDVLGTVLEVMSQGVYFWVPLEYVETVALNPPRFPRDVIWLPVRMDTQKTEGAEVFLPNLYCGSYAAESDDDVRLGRVTDWQETADGPVAGVGAKMFLMGEDSCSLLEWRELTLEHPAPAGEAAPA